MNSLTHFGIIATTSYALVNAIPITQNSEIRTTFLEPYKEDFFTPDLKTVKKRQTLPPNTTTPMTYAESGSGFITDPFYSENQFICAERLGVSLDECNTHGVYINRTQTIQNHLLETLNKDSWENVTQEILESIYEIQILNQKIPTLKTHDFDGLNQTTKLILNQNNITKLPETIFNPLNALSYISVSGNLFTTLANQTLNHLLQLIHLDLYKNNLQTLPINSLNTLPKLKSINLYENQLKILQNHVLNNASMLETLSINDNPLLEIQENALQGLDNLDKLHIENCPLTTLPENDILALKKLSELFATNTPLNLSLNFFHTAPFKIVFKENSESSISIAFDNSNILLQKIAHFFEPTKDESNRTYITPNTLNLSEFDSKTIRKKQIKFLCAYLKLSENKNQTLDKLENELLAACKSNFTTTDPCEENPENENCQSNIKTIERELIIHVASAIAAGLGLVSILSIGLYLLSKYCNRKNPTKPFKYTDPHTIYENKQLNETLKY